MAGFVKITPEGESFIKNACSGTDSLLRGSGILPFSYPLINRSWIAQPKDGAGNVITTNSDLGKQIIKWYNKYAAEYNMDANILAAQAYQESKYVLWAFPPERTKSTATGISQFLLGTMYDVIIRDIYNAFSDDEKNLIKNNCSGDTSISSTYNVSYKIGRYNRPIIHQNAMDNPQIMIKAQIVYMNAISIRAKNIASTALYGYNRGPGYIPKLMPSYSQTINYTKLKKGDEYPKEGIDYVFKIFNYLGNPKYDKNGYFGYNKPPFNINCDISIFDSYQASVDESNLLY